MLRLLETIAWAFWYTIDRIVALITPFRRGREFFRMGRGLRAFIHVLIVAGVLVGLWWLNTYFDLGKLLKAPTLFRIPLRDFWLPILFLLLYSMVWLGWWLWKLLGPEEYVSVFPDLDEAWDEAVAALHAAQIDLSDAPLFLVLGKTAGGEEALFGSAQLSLTVKQAPARPDAPLYVHANRDGIYVSCPDASLLSKQSTLLRGETSGTSYVAEPEAAPSEEDMYKTLQPKGRLKDVQGVLARAREQGRTPDQLTDAEKEEIRHLISEDEADYSRQAQKPRASLARNTAEIERMTARLKHVCRLIVQDRRPYCPLNGIMVLLPFAATDQEEDATQTGLLCQQELAAARSVLQVNCPVIALVCDLEMTPGFREFVERFPADQRQRRLGQRFPLVPDLEEKDVPAMIEGGVAWMSQAMLPNWIYKLFRLETPGKDDLAAAVRGNTQLYRLLGEVRERYKRLSRILVRGLIREDGRPTLFGGCYIGGTGRDAPREQAFVPGVFRRLIDNQNYVAWTDEAWQEDAASQQWTTYGYTALAIAAVALAALAFFFWQRR